MISGTSPTAPRSRRWTDGFEHPRFGWVFAPLVMAAFLSTLGRGDLKPWDEALYATRTLAVVDDGEWLDQSAGSPGGLWIGSHPPLAIWAMAISCQLFGVNEWSLRLTATLCALGCFAVLWLLAGLLTERRSAARLAAIALFWVPFFTDYGRRAQLDAPVLFFMTLSLLLFVVALRRSEDRSHLDSGVFALSGVALGLGLLAKIIVAALIPMSLVAFVAWQWRRRETRAALPGLAIAGGVALVVAAPWFVAMSRIHGLEYWRQTIGYHVLSRMTEALESHSSPLGVFYWPVEIAQHLAALAPFAVVGIARGEFARSWCRRLALCWLGVPFVVFTATSTKHDPYLLMFLLPLVFFAALGLEAWLRGRLSPRSQAWLLATAVACLIWNLTHPLHEALEAVASALRQPALPAAGPSLAVAGFVAGTLILGLGLRRIRQAHAVAVALLVMVAVPGTVMAFRPLRVKHTYWSELSAALAERPPPRLTFIGEPNAVDRYYLQATTRGRDLDVAFLPSEELDSARGDFLVHPRAVTVGDLQEFDVELRTRRLLWLRSRRER